MVAQICYYCLIQMESIKNKFIRVFQTNSKHQIENIDPLTHSLPPRHIQLSNNAIQILQQVRDSIVCVSALGFNAYFFELIRKILFLDSFQEETNTKKNSNNLNEFCLSTKIELVPKERIQWVYGQMKLRRYDKEEKLSPIYLGKHQLYEQRFQTSSLASAMASLILFVQIDSLSSADQIIALLKKLNQKMDDLSGGFPKVYFLIDDKQQNEINLPKMLVSSQFKIAYQMITVGDWAKNWDQQFRLINLGKGIVQNLRPKVINKVAINGRFLSILWCLLASQEDKSAQNSFRQASQALIQEQSQQALHHYVSRIQEITQGQELLSSSFFKNIETKVRTDIMRQVTERTGALSERDDIMRTQKRLLEMREQMENRNQQAVIDWGRQLLRESWAAIDKKIGKQIKSIPVLKQQVSIFVQFFRKKSDSFLSIELLIILLDFLIPKILETAQTIDNISVNALKEQQQALQMQLVNYSSDIKDLRKKVSKEQGELSRKIMDLKQKNFIFQVNLKKAEKTLQQANQSIQQNKQLHEQRISKMGEQHQALLQKRQKAIDELVQRSEAQLKNISLLENELTKEKLLHKQTKQFYEQSIDNLKSRQLQLGEALQEFNLSASRELDMMKCSSTKEIGSFQTANAELVLKISSLEQQMMSKDQVLEKTKVELLRLKEESQQKELAFVRINQLQFRNRVLEEYESQCGALRARLRKLQDQIKKVQREKQQKVEQCRHKETATLILTQKYDYLQKNLEEEKNKNRAIVNQLQTANRQRQELSGELRTFKNRIPVDYCCQVEDNSVKQKLKMALEMIKEIESEYAQLKVQNQRQHRRMP